MRLFAILLNLLNNPGCFKCFVGAALGKSFEPFGRKGDNNRAVKLRHKDALFLHVRLFAYRAGGVVFGGAHTVAVTAADTRPLFGDWTDFRHRDTHGTIPKHLCK